MEVLDSAWPEAQFVSGGAVSQKYDSVSVGATVKHSYTVTPKSAGAYRHNPVFVTYLSEEGGKQQVRGAGAGARSGWRRAGAGA